MSTDIARLGLQVDSRPVAAATTELNKLVPAARAAEAATKGLEAAAAANAATMNKAAGGARPLADAANKTATGFKNLSFEARNLGFQLVDVTQGALMGQSAFQILAQQGGQLAQIAAFSETGLGGLFKQLGSTFAGLLTPMRLLGAGAIAATVAAYAMNSAWKSSALEMDNTGRAIGTTITQLRGLDRAAAIKGIEDFSKDAEKFAANIYQARNGMGSLGDVLRANGERATDFVGTLESAARIIGRSATDQQKLQLLQQMGLPATMQWVRFLSQGSDAIKQAAGEANGFIAKEQELINKARQFDEGWSSAWRSFKTSAFDAFLSSKGWLTELGNLSARWRQYFNPTDANARVGASFGDLSGFQNPALQSALEKRARQMRGEPAAVDPALERARLAAESPFIGMLGSAPSIAELKRREADEKAEPLPTNDNRSPDDRCLHRRAA